MHRELGPVDPKRMKHSLSGCDETEDKSYVDALVDEVLREDVSDLAVRSSSLSDSSHTIDNNDLKREGEFNDSFEINNSESCYESEDFLFEDSDATEVLFGDFAVVEESIRLTQLHTDADEEVISDDNTQKSSVYLIEPNDVRRDIMLNGPNLYVEKQIKLGQDPAVILEILGYSMPDGLFYADYLAKWNYVRRILMKHVYERPRLGLNSIDDVVNLLRTSKKILVLTGAGISVSCGIPDFRSENGLYARIGVQFGLPEPECMFDIEYFKVDPEPFFSFAKEILPNDSFTPSFSHYFIKHAEQNNQLLRQFTQNIDTLEQSAGIERVVYCHGSFSSASCMDCKKIFTFEQFKEALQLDNVPSCDKCDGFIKPDIVFFGESLPKSFDEHLATDCFETDLVLVIGSSLKVHPVSSIPDLIPPNVPQILINRESLDHNFDIELLGNCDEILAYLFRRLGWEFRNDTLNSRFRHLLHDTPAEPAFVEPIFHLFPGAKFSANKDRDISLPKDSKLEGGLVSPSELETVEFPLYTGTDLPETGDTGSIVNLPDIQREIKIAE